MDLTDRTLETVRVTFAKVAIALVICQIMGAIGGRAAAQNDVSPLPDSGLIVAAETDEPNRFDDLHDTLEERLRASATWLDSFFEDERHETESNKTSFRLRFEVFNEVADSASFNIKGNLRLLLPNTGERLMLVVSGSPDSEEDITDTDEDDIREEFESTDEENLSVGLQYYLLRKLKRNLSAQGGLRFRSGGPVVYTGVRYRELVDLGTWDLRMTERLRWYSDNGFESKTNVDFERPVFEEMLFRTALQGSWFQDESGFFYDVNFRLFQPLSDRRVLEYQLNNQFQTSPNNRLEQSSIRLRYRQRLWRDWLALELIPQVRFPRSRDFKATPGAMVRFELTFGG